MRASRFTAILDDALRRVMPEPVSPRAGWSRVPSAEMASPFLFARPFAAAAPRRVPLGLPPAPRPAHPLTAEQQQAFARFERLGVTLPAGFTAEELRSAYRRLALRFHPDRHGDRSALEREQRARNFAEAADLHRCLRAVVDPRH